ncbi:bestrophin family protein [Rosistilla oblonga]|uniref:Bestrophin, RFP-TM, chloride channel n=2 Tax=Rosistilla oblonga TaxID=2527990 RepID=A0A518IXD2_9BACT|nr:Bestrophin, RFP-TM, chloride channel [Rosistilla oblonga]
MFTGMIRPLATSKTLAYVGGLALLVGCYSLLPIWLEYSRYHDAINTPSQFHGVLSFVLGLLLVFRTNTAYSRWWEARILWGGLVNACRNLGIKLTSSDGLTDETRSRALQLIVAFPVALRCHLREEIDDETRESLELLVGRAKHIPQAIAAQLYQIVWDAKRSGRIDGDELRVLDAELLRLMDICGGCERILKTRIVKSYRVFARQCVGIFLVSLPWAIVHDFRIWTLFITIITAYFMLGLETVAEHVETPFGYDEDDLDLESLCATIDTTVHETFSHHVPA